MDTSDTLRDLVKEKLASCPFIVVSNREPYIHRLVDEEIQCFQPASGLTTGLDPVLQASGGVWVAQGVGDADRLVVDAFNKVAVPPESPKYTLKRVWLDEQEERGFADGLSNDALWPLCHIAYTRPIFRETDWTAYQEANHVFAASVLEEVSDGAAFVFIQDYHFSMLSRYLKEQRPSILTAQFWHIPWPNPETFGVFPWQEEILDGLLGNDLLAFHTSLHSTNFMATVAGALEAKVDYEQGQIFRGGHRTAIRVFPISVDFEAINQDAQGDDVEREMVKLKERLGLTDELIGVGLDRIDYTKGLPERLRALDHVLDRHPEYVGKLVFLQMGATSRLRLASYQSINEEIDNLVAEINTRYGNDHWKPIIYLPDDPPATTRMASRRLAHFCIVSSLHDGMNLVAKEFVASRFDEDGVLILSTFTGAARELTDALLVNPYATDQLAEAIHTALQMPEEERRHRMQRMRSVVQEHNIYKWATDLISEFAGFGETPLG
jgi:trehalose 6-phosphate synthase